MLLFHSRDNESTIVNFTCVRDLAYARRTMANILSVAGSDSKYKVPDARPAGFLGGLWRGMIAPITFIVSLFANEVSIYETNNNGR
jgi:hypothetical protein